MEEYERLASDVSVQLDLSLPKCTPFYLVLPSFSKLYLVWEVVNATRR